MKRRCRIDDGRVHDRAAGNLQSLLRQMHVHQPQQLGPKVTRLHQMPEL